MTINIVPIELSHIESYHRVLDSVARESRNLAFFEAPPLDQVRAFVEMNIKIGRPQFVALEKSNLIGWCDIIQKDRPMYAHSGALGMGVLSEFRGLGYGRSLIERTLEEAKRQNITRIELTVRASNRAAIKLYESVGFSLEGTLMDDAFIDGQYENSHIMALLTRQ